MQQTHPLPKKKPIQMNSIVRVLNLDIGNPGFFYFQTNREDDVENGLIKLTMYRQDVKDDRTNIFKKSESMKIKRKLEVEIPVRADLYRLFGLGTLSKDLSFAIILPDKPDKLPKGIRDDDLWYELFSNLINKKNTMATIAGHYEERLDKQSEMMVRDNRDIEEDRFFHKVTKIYDKLTGKEEKEGTKKSKE